MSDLPGGPPSQQALDRAWDELRERLDKFKKKHPVQIALWRARLERVNRYIDSGRELLRKAGNDRITIPKELLVLGDEITELMNWEPATPWYLTSSLGTTPPSEIETANRKRKHSSGLTEEQVDRAAEYLLRNQYPMDFVREVLKRGGRGFRGRPVSKRGLAIKALEARMGDPHLSWSKLARRYCDCGEKSHGFKCRDRIRKNVGQLKRILAKYNIQLPAHRGNKSP